MDQNQLNEVLDAIETEANHDWVSLLDVASAIQDILLISTQDDRRLEPAIFDVVKAMLASERYRPVRMDSSTSPGCVALSESPEETLMRIHDAIREKGLAQCWYVGLFDRIARLN